MIEFERNHRRASEIAFDIEEKFLVAFVEPEVKYEENGMKITSIRCKHVQRISRDMKAYKLCSWQVYAPSQRVTALGDANKGNIIF